MNRSPSQPVVTLDARANPWWVDWGELWSYRDFFLFMVYKEIRVRYAQSALGVGWAVVQPLATMGVFTVVFGGLVGVQPDGDVHYAIFSLVALVPWTYFSGALNLGASSLVLNASIISKIYFPRVFLPLVASAAQLVDLLIGFLLLVGMMVLYGVVPSVTIWMVPLLLILLVLTLAGAALWLSALAIQYRDVKYAAAFLIQLWMYVSPVVYPTSSVPTAYQPLYALNPLVGVIEGLRAALLGTRAMPWNLILIGAGVAMLMAVSGFYYFRQRERLFADVA